jgi:hypothetical protein
MAPGQTEEQQAAAVAKLAIMQHPDSANPQYAQKILAGIEYAEGTTPDKPKFSSHPKYSSLEMARVLKAFFVIQDSMEELMPILEELDKLGKESRDE